MRILLDQATPVALRKALAEHSVSTAYEQGWSVLKNGDLIKAAEKQFDVLVTTDKNLRHQQNLEGLHLSILVLPSGSWPKLRHHTAAIAAAISALKPGEYKEFQLD